jgi:hypothetical protein
VVEHVLGKDGVGSSILLGSTIYSTENKSKNHFGINSRLMV